MILVGYDRDSANYRIMDPETLKITIIRDIIVNGRSDAQSQARKSEHTNVFIQRYQRQRRKRG